MYGVMDIEVIVHPNPWMTIPNGLLEGGIINKPLEILPCGRVGETHPRMAIIAYEE